MSDTDALITVTTGRGEPIPGQLWFPVQGEECDQLLRGLSLREDEREVLTRESASILARCTDPSDPASSRRAGLVVGGVQSGKTLSFTTVAALARDNGYHLVVIIAGTKDNLLEQSRNRLADDLELRRGDAHYRWVHHRSPSPGTTDVDQLSADLNHALEGDPHWGEAPTVLVTVMKNHRHMANAARVLRQAQDNVNLDAITALVIDDEADQATPNLRRTGESPTYRNLRAIRDALPRHTLLEYTATPQAPLLVSITDELSPDFTCVLTPGNDYTGGQFFFQDHRDSFLRIIPANDLDCLDDSSLGPPESLLDALATFFVGATAAQVDRHNGRASQRSMLVHPSHATLPQAAFTSWLDSARRGWVLALREGGPDADELVATHLRPAYDDLARSVDDISSWRTTVDRLPTVMSRARIEEVNTRSPRSRPIAWSDAYAWILVGGAMLDRGFTVEGLTVTYMPRGTGVGNADTVQQRGRFFGYKHPYAGYCRAWLESDVADAFSSYVAHEESMRRELREVEAAGQPMQQWRRRFLLDPDLRPTRRAVIRMPLSRWQLNARWLHQWHVPLPPATEGSLDIVANNKQAVDQFCSRLDWSIDEELSGSTSMQQHERDDVSLRRIYEDLLVEMTFVEDDHPTFLGLMLSIEDYLQREPDATATVYRMSGGAARVRALDEGTAKIKQLLQGRSREGTSVYAGDRLVRDNDRLTVQIHHVNVRPSETSTERIYDRVPFLALWIPRELGLESALVQADQ